MIFEINIEDKQNGLPCVSTLKIQQLLHPFSVNAKYLSKFKIIVKYCVKVMF